ncbi:MAG: ferrochelatase [Chloroflexi bacterium]|nr:MAG: ferrochelatase [Chloroflexota bacterium]TMD82844.1 MAG: ferrochelatase [Chloroflexota bacterium]
MPPNHTAVLLMAYGSPNRLEEVEAYYTDIRGGRVPSREAVEELTARYRQVGLPTPLLAVSLDLGRQLERRLNADSPDGGIYTVHLGMKHWTPRIAAAVEEAVDAGADRLIAIVLAPHYSGISTEGYRRQVAAALVAAAARPHHNGSAAPVELDFVDSWHDLDGYLQAVADNLRSVRVRFREPERVVVIFTAHSLPARILDEGDPYQDQLLRTSELVAARAGVDNWRFSYQSQSRTGEPWLGPDLPEMVERLAREGHRSILVASIGFIADHLEIFYDIDIEAKAKADALGIELKRTPMLNADPRLAQALHALVAERIPPTPTLPHKGGGRLTRMAGS